MRSTQSGAGRTVAIIADRPGAALAVEYVAYINPVRISQR
jgi:hypothetical protein